MASAKTAIIEQLFRDRYDPRTATVTPDVVTLREVSDTMRRLGSTLSDRNAANFMKDIVRSPNRNAIIPARVVHAGWTVKQAPGKGGCFRFVPLPLNQSTAFVTALPSPSLTRAAKPVQTLSLAPASRKFGRTHETWLTHVITNVGLVHTHLALFSSIDLLGLELLQSNVHLGDAEIDAIYLGTLRSGAEILVTCEMKGLRDVLDEDQIERGAQRVRTNSNGSTVVPIGIKTLPRSMVWLVEFEPSFPPLAKASEAVYRLMPPVPGVG